MVRAERERLFLLDQNKLARFELLVMPHRKAAYNLARWMTRNDHDAEDVVQEAYVRAFTFFDGFRGEDGRAWLLAVVRNTCYTWLEKYRSREPALRLDEKVHAPSTALDPAQLFLEQAAGEEVRRA